MGAYSQIISILCESNGQTVHQCLPQERGSCGNLANTVKSAYTVYLLLFTAPGTCDFESGLCGYVHDQNSDFEWTNNTGHTLSLYTGPKGDHTIESGHASAFLSIDLLGRLNGLQRNNLTNTRSVSGKNIDSPMFFYILQGNSCNMA